MELQQAFLLLLYLTLVAVVEGDLTIFLLVQLMMLVELVGCLVQEQQALLQ